MYPRITRFVLLIPLAQLCACGPASDQQANTVESETPAISLARDILPAANAVGYEQVKWPNDANKGHVKEIDWDALIPIDWQPENLLGSDNIDELEDDDPRAQQLLDKLKALWQQAPVVDELDGKRVKLPGFVVPLEMDEKKIDRFLLVPYYGACIHVPPPPANQTVHVVTRDGKAFEGQLFDAVWVSGTMRVERLSSELAEAGYRLENAVVAPFE